MTMMEDMYDQLPDTTNTEGYTSYTHQMAQYETFGSPWMSTSSAVSVSAASDHDLAAANSNTGNSSSLEEENSSAMKARISSHPLYPKLLEAYIDCHKVGVPPETANLLDESLQENDLTRNTTLSYHFGEDRELDEFMKAYCDVLAKCKSDLVRPFEEATTFLSNMETQLSNLCNKNTAKVPDEAGGSCDDDTSSGNGEAELKECDGRSEPSEIKNKLLHKYSGYISSLRHEFCKTKKKGKLPTDARQILLNWWTIHYNWPYPTEADKVALAESTGLDQKQINNWFINQRKRHWKPSDKWAPIAMNDLYGSFFPE